MKESNKGFTIAELVIVIAIVAILAAVTVTSYTDVIGKANLVKDQQAIRTLNENLAIAAAANPPATAGDAIGMLLKLGICGEKLTAHTSGYKYVYNLAENRFYLADDAGEVVYPEKADKANLWALYTDKPGDKLPGFTNYVATGTVANQDALTAVFGDGASYRFDLDYLPDDSFDLAILSHTLQETRRPDKLLSQIVRISKTAAVSVINFGHWRCRLQVAFKGKMPRSSQMPFQWYDTPNIHFCTLQDFRELCSDLGIKILAEYPVPGRYPRLTKRNPNLFAIGSVFVLSK